jgi:hypothetical protein
MPGWLWAVIAIVLGILIYLLLRRRGGRGRHRGIPAIEYLPEEHLAHEGPVDGADHVELAGHVDHEGHVELEGHVERDGGAGDFTGPAAEEPRAASAPSSLGGKNVPESSPLSPPPVSEEPRTESTSRRGGAADPQAGPTPDLRASDYGPGSAVPDTAGVGPQGWTVKGNADSMLFYTADAPNYLRSAADVWFESEEAALTAGFTRWNAHHR